MPRRGEKCRAGGKWTEAKYWQYIRGLLRQGFLYYPAKAEAKKLAGRRNGRCMEYQCAHCDDWFGTKEVHIDHILPCGSLKGYDDLAGFVERMYCEVDNLQVLCKQCHAVKTRRDNKRTRRIRNEANET